MKEKRKLNVQRIYLHYLGTQFRRVFNQTKKIDSDANDVEMSPTATTTLTTKTKSDMIFW